MSARGAGPDVHRVRSTGVIVSLALVAVLLLMVGAGLWSLLGRPASDAAGGRTVTIEVAAGSSTAEIGRLLADAGVVPNANMFRLRARIARADGRLKAGTYELATGIGYAAAIRALEAGPPAVYRTVTIPEGFVLEQIAERLERDAGVPSDEFLGLAKTGAAEFVAEHPYLDRAFGGSLEGYLFPKTYRIREGTSAREVISLMLDQFDAEIAQVDTAGTAQASLSTAQLVTIASIIERETKLAEERSVVSSVIYNRLERGMLLEIDATIEYVLPGNRFRLRNRDLRIDSPYNTYRNKGLPPGPISNPGLASLQAAAQPADTPYIYYVLTGKDGSHTFAADLETFLAAKQKSKEVFGR